MYAIFSLSMRPLSVCSLSMLCPFRSVYVLSLSMLCLCSLSLSLCLCCLALSLCLCSLSLSMIHDSFPSIHDCFFFSFSFFLSFLFVGGLLTKGCGKSL
jgi:hypothetical protein